jgi:hypothetical protein
MRRTISLALVLVACVSHAQVRKCVGADGKISYSDVICAGGASEKGVRTDANTIDTSGFRKQAEQDKASATEQTKLDSTKPAQQSNRLDSEPPPKTILPPKPRRFTR